LIQEHRSRLNIVAAELRYGYVKTRSPQLLSRVRALLAAVPVLPFDVPADEAYGSIRAALEAIGQTIGANDLLIAAHAVALGSTVVTANVGEFRRVDGLSVENWLV
jgi:tRNA(fMet)-specific endonuclease VapC